MVGGGVIVACVGDDPGSSASPPSLDGGAEDGSVAQDAAPPVDDAGTPPCNLEAPFGQPVLVPVINSDQTDQAARLSADELTIFFSSERPDGGVNARDIYAASRTSRRDPFGPPAVVAELVSPFADSAPMLTPDGTTLFFESTRPGSVKHDLWVATRTPASPFGNLTRLGMFDNDSDERTPFLSVADDTLWFASNRHIPDSSYILFRAKRTLAGFDAPVAADELNTTDSNWFPVVSLDGLTLYWASDRPDGGAKGKLDIWRARRSKTSELFGSPENVAELNTPDAEAPTWLSPDGCRLYLQRNIGDGPSSIYLAEKPAK